MTDLTTADLEKLAEWDTPTICNGLEALDPEWRLTGYTTTAFTCLRPRRKADRGLCPDGNDPGQCKTRDGSHGRSGAASGLLPVH